MENVEQPKRIVGVFYVAAAIVVGIFLTRILGAILNQAGVNDPRIDLGFIELGNVSTLVGFGVAILAAFLVWRLPKTQQVSVDVVLELRRVTWPSWRETRAATIAVIIASFVAAVILGLFDAGWAKLAAWVYK